MAIASLAVAQRIEFPGEDVAVRRAEIGDPPLDLAGEWAGQVAVAARGNRHLSSTPLTYNPRKNQPGSVQATASAQGVLDRVLAALGIANLDVTASSVTLWRVHTVWVQQGEDAAVQVSGRHSRDQMLQSLALPLERPDDDTPLEVTRFAA